ncbi:VWA domain-containing protein [Nanoarchaeota archaeon]
MCKNYQVVIYFSLEQEIKEITKAEQSSGKMQSSMDDKLMHSVLENDKKTLDEGKLIEEALNMNISSFSPDLMFEQLVSNYQMAKKIMGPSIIRLLSGYDERYVEKNLNIPEFKRKVKQNIEENIEALKDKKILDKHGGITEKGVELASLILYIQEVENILPKGTFGEKVSKERSVYGEKGVVIEFRKGDRYKDLAIKPTIRRSIKRKHKRISFEDLRKFERVKKGKIDLVYALDASASMKGKRIAMCKKAGIALAFKALSKRDSVGLIVFGKDVRDSVRPTQDFGILLNKITRVTASQQTDFVKMIKKAVELFPKERTTKHLLILTDAMPTAGETPETDTLRAVSLAKDNSVTVSIIGIGLDRKAVKFARKLTLLGDGRLYLVRNLNNLDKIVLQDYESLV